MPLPEVGHMAPKFTLLNQLGEKVSLESFRGKKNVVLYFYPRASTPGCTVQACGLRDTKKELEDLDVVVLGVSPDTVKRVSNFVEKQSLNFDLLADEDRAIAEKYGVWQLKKFMGKENMGVVRTTFIIDKDGRLVGMLPKFTTKNHHDVLLDYLTNNLLG
ncbi:Peroxiredoxin Bcp [BD1-7 clade bacterium]|uniref:thioredoxin-dependent peroxiredoxin n=1 Tax=BD1-7 clade bacterium TaxID=2029982 RepID=A0A5S9QND5_9GAMM|nr:Peroxiredoxin Bcp [BD1-7 clade bacterium]CAA0120645.1 Peroxiredoxin Bcp [BD1-7 clade bacterium]